mgnify:CR=1 FL=1
MSEEEEVRYLGWNARDKGCRIVEGPDLAPVIPEQADLWRTLDDDGEGRTADLVGLSDRGKVLVSGLTPKVSVTLDSI